MWAPVDTGRYFRFALAGGDFGVGWLAHCDLLHVNLLVASRLTPTA